MKLYLFEHCFLCFRVRMTAALKRIPLQEVVVLDDDTGTMTSLVGKRAVPILIKQDGRPMLESMDMVRYIDQLDAPVLTGPERPEVAAWAKRIAPKAAPLTQSRYPLLGLPEFASPAALEHYHRRKRQTLGDLAALRADTDRYLDAIEPELAAIDRMIGSLGGANGALSLDDVRVLPQLRSLAVVKRLRFPQRLRAYFETMMARIGHRPLPAI